MGKIICEVCGTSFPETAEQCPICGCVKSGEPTAMPDLAAETAAADAARHVPVKGGRFSKSNVKKRSGAAAAPARAVKEEKKRTEEKKEKAEPQPKNGEKSAIDKWLTAAIIVLLLSVVAIIIYIALTFFDVQLPQLHVPGNTLPGGTSEVQTTTAPVPSDTASGTEPSTQPQEVACQALKIASDTIKLDKTGAAVLLNIEVIPAECTETITYTSADESVATVTESGKIVAVGSGSTVVSAVCGDVKLECTVLVEVSEPTTAPTTEPTEPPTTEPPATEPPTKPAEFELNRSDFTLAAKGESWVLYTGSVPKNQITWSSDDESVATVTGGKVVAVGPGVTTVRAEYNGIKDSCIVRCSFSAETTEPSTAPTEPSTAPTEPSTAPTEPSVAPTEPTTEPTAPTGSNTETKTYTISHTDVTIAVGERFDLILRDSDGNKVSVTWAVSESGVCSVSGSTVTGAASGTVKVYTPYGGREYSCIVRVK